MINSNTHSQLVSWFSGLATDLKEDLQGIIKDNALSLESQEQVLQEFVAEFCDETISEEVSTDRYFMGMDNEYQCHTEYENILIPLYHCALEEGVSFSSAYKESIHA